MVGGTRWFAAIRQTIRPQLIELIFYSFFVNILALVIPLFVLQVYNRVVAFGNIATLQGLVGGVALALLFDFLLRQIRSRLIQRVALRLDMGLSDLLMKKIWALPLRHLESRSSSYWLGLFRDTDTVRNTVAGPPFLLLVDLPFAILFIVLIFIIAKPIAWVFLSFIPIFILLAAISGKMVAKASDAEKNSRRSRDSIIGDMIGSRGTVKALSLDRGLAKMSEAVFADTVEQSLKRGVRQDGFINAGTVLTLSTTVVITSFGALAIINQELSIGALIAANMLSNRVISPFSQLVGAWKNFASFRQSMTRLTEVMKMPTEREVETIFPDQPTGHMKAENITFKYASDGEPVLENLSVDFKSNAVHMLMGPNGGGKSTLAKLLKGLYMPEDGRVLLDGADISQFTRSQLSQWIGYVPQETVMLQGSIRENIAGLRDDISDAEIIEACSKVGIHQMISNFPDGYGTDVGEAGSALSGGIRQRLSIARVLVGKPAVLLFDEPTASLDRQAENAFRDLLKTLSEEATIIVISHSPILLGATDYLHLVDRKRIILSGPRDDVLKAIDQKSRQMTANGDSNGKDPKIGGKSEAWGA
ncbi:peptidase domain-containing ABC transporter [Sneathiella sp.]|jgi:ATP-binding cassette subfamily C protein LapB|uniref:peptidase domain-containing ABC transporter n=1 Tax=Sneathiella sp. TaxID=1964365 RepID=UPI0039E35C37